ncbi:MAG: molecular chaperone HtpG [Bacteroidota bacterium]
MKNGTINVSTENIFPIIKKFLYSDHEIFLRELVSNSVDACKKLQALRALGEAPASEEQSKVEVIVDKEAKTIKIIDNGIGMTSEEVEKYINQIAFSGAEEFLNKYKDKTDTQGIIGHFGLGFYSAFMVAAKVEIETLSFKPDAKAVHWTCDGSPNYSLNEIEKSSVGTTITLNIAEDSEEFLETVRINTLLTKYCKFLPVNVEFDGKAINNIAPAWTKKPADLQEEDYKNFYRELYPMSFDEPLFHIHLNVDYPFNLTGILFFPQLKKNFEPQKDKIQLYSNQVFVTDAVENIVPEFLTMLKGVLDSPDIPLNVSRSYLQSDANVKKISNHITKKVADKLDEMYKKDRADFENKWNDISVFVKYGMISEEKFYEKANKFFLFKNVDSKLFSIEEYAEKIKESHKDKENKVVYLYANNQIEQHTFIESAKERGYDVLLMDGPFDSHFINFLESKIENSKFVRVDGDSVEKLIEKDLPIPAKLSEDEQNNLKSLFETVVEKEKFTVAIENLQETDQPMLITQPEFMRRMKEMNQFGGGMSFMGTMPEMFNLVVNANHPIMQKILGEKDETKKQDLLKQTTDLALLSQNMLKGEELSKFIKRSLQLI